MKKIILLFVFALFSITINAQFLKFEWAKSMGGIDYDYSESITTDASGNVYITGYYRDTVDFDPGAGIANLISVGGNDIFVLKLDASGNFLWAKSMGGIGRDRGYSITTDISENIYITGGFSDTVDFDPGTGIVNLTSKGYWDIYVLKLDASGNFLWAKSMGGNVVDRGYSIITDTFGNIYVTGDFSNIIDFDSDTGIANLTSIGSFDIFILKLDTSGNFLWAKSMGGNDYDIGQSITTDASGNIYVTGYFQGIGYFDPGSGIANLISTGGSQDIFVLKLDASGNFLWVKSMGGINGDDGNSITTDASGNSYITGNFYGINVDFDPGMGTANLTSIGQDDIFIQKLDTSGNFLWVKSMGGIYSDRGNSITTDIAGNVYITGGFSDTVDFDPGTGIVNLTSKGNDDIFILKLSPCIESPLIPDIINLLDSISECPIIPLAPTATNNCRDVFFGTPNISFPITTLDTTVIIWTYDDNNGNIFTQTQNVIITPIDTTVFKNGVMLIAKANNYTYQWIDCNNGNSSIIGETNQSFTPVTNGNYAVKISNGTCTVVSNCFEVIVNSIESETVSDITIYPNPTTNIIHIDKGNFTEIEIKILDYTGKLIISKTTKEQITSIDLNGYASGIYFIILNDGQKKTAQKILKIE